MNRWNDVPRSRLVPTTPALIVFLAGIVFSTPPSAAETEGFFGRVGVGDITIGVELEGGDRSPAAYGILDGLASVTDGMAVSSPGTGYAVSFSGGRVITTDLEGATEVHAADLDGDGDADVLSASTLDHTIAWYENLGGGAFSKRRVITRDAVGASDVHAADLDGDGDADVLSASGDDDTIAWHENRGGGAFSKRRVITRDVDEPYAVYAADLDGDGDADVLSASGEDDTIAWYENRGGGAFSKPRVITRDANRAYAVYAADLDGDGDADVLSGSTWDDTVAWHENRGGGAFSKPRVITRDADGPVAVHAADLDGDGDADVLSASTWDNTVAWHENHGDGAFSKRRVITRDAVNAGSVYPADLDGDGDLDVLSASLGDDTIAWHENRGDGAFSEARVITRDADEATAVYAADLDGDGDADVLSASYADGKIAWYENLNPVVEPRPVEATVAEASRAPDATTGEIARALAEWLEQGFESAGMRLELAGPLRTEEDGSDSAAVRFPGARLVGRDGGGGFALGDLDLRVTAEDTTEYRFELALPATVEMFTRHGRPDGRMTVDESGFSGRWRSDLAGATALDVAVSGLRIFSERDRQPFEIESLEVATNVDQDSAGLWDGGFTMNLSTFSITPGLRNEGLRLGGLDLTVGVEDFALESLSSIPGADVATEGSSELEALQVVLAQAAQGGLGRVEIGIALRDLLGLDGGEVTLGLGAMDAHVVLEGREALGDLVIGIEAAEPRLNEAIAGGLVEELIPRKAIAEIALVRFPLRRIAEKFGELATSSGTRAARRALEQVVMAETTEAGTAIEIRDIHIVSPSLAFRAGGVVEIDARSPMGATGHLNARLRRFGKAIEWAAMQGRIDFVSFLVFLKGLGEPLDREDGEVPSYSYALKAARDGTVTVNDVPLAQLLDTLR